MFLTALTLVLILLELIAAVGIVALVAYGRDHYTLSPLALLMIALLLAVSALLELVGLVLP